MATKAKERIQKLLAQRKALRGKVNTLRAAPNQTSSAAQGDMGFDPAMLQEFFNDPSFLQEAFGGQYGGMDQGYSDPYGQMQGYGGYDPYGSMYGGYDPYGGMMGGYGFDPYQMQGYQQMPQEAYAAPQNANPTTDQYTYA